MCLSFGKNKQVDFTSCNEKYKFIGYLASHDVDIKWEDNDLTGAWAKEGRMAFMSDKVKIYFPSLGYTAGIKGVYDSRINCNDFVKILFDLGFIKGKKQDISAIKAKIPTQYHPDFEKGISLP